MLVGTWKVESVDLGNIDKIIDEQVSKMNLLEDNLMPKKGKKDDPKIKKALEEMKAKRIDSVKNILKGRFEESKKAMMDASLTFNKDNTFETVSMGKTEKGKWSISEDEKTLTQTMDNGMKGEMTLDPEALKNGQLVLSMTDGGNTTKIIFKKQ